MRSVIVIALLAVLVYVSAGNPYSQAVNNAANTLNANVLDLSGTYDWAFAVTQQIKAQIKASQDAIQALADAVIVAENNKETAYTAWQVALNEQANALSERDAARQMRDNAQVALESANSDLATSVEALDRAVVELREASDDFSRKDGIWRVAVGVRDYEEPRKTNDIRDLCTALNLIGVQHGEADPICSSVSAASSPISTSSTGAGSYNEPSSTGSSSTAGPYVTGPSTTGSSTAGPYGAGPSSTATYQVDNGPWDATLRLSVDDESTVFLNGQEILRTNNWNSLYTANFKVNRGDVLTIQAYNIGGPGAIIGQVKFLTRIYNTNAYYWRCVDGFVNNPDKYEVSEWPQAIVIDDAGYKSNFQFEEYQYLIWKDSSYVAGDKVTCAVILN